MKRIFKAAWILAASALAFSSCVEEQNLAPQDEQADMVTINITAGSAQTKTHYDGTTQIKWDQTGEKLEVLQQKLTGTSFERVTSTEGTSSTDGLTATFKATLPTATGTFGYYAVYPSTNCVASNNTAIDSTKLEIPKDQHPISLTSFDPAADLLVSKALQATEQPAKLDFQFARPIAIMEMTVKGLGVNETIQSVEFSNSTANLSGRMYYNFPANKVFKCGYYGKKMVNCIYDMVTYNTDPQGNKIYFTVLPTDLADFAVKVTTDKATYTKTVKPETALTIKPNDLVKFSVAGLKRIASVTDKYKLLTDASQLNEGDRILIVAGEKSNTVAMAAQAKDYRETVPVTVNSDNTITTLPDGIQIIELLDSKTNGEFILRTSNNPVSELEHHGSNNLYSENPGSSWKININAEGVTTILTGTDRYIQYNHASTRFAAYKRTQGDVKIFYKDGNPREALATPTNVSATVTEGTNVANVSWTPVEKAVSYTVTCGEIVKPVNAPETSATIADLAWGTTHTITVVANPAEASETLKSSAAATTKVTIGANPNVQILLNDGDYVVMCKDDATYKALTSTSSTYNIAAADLPYDGSAQEVTTTKDFIWHIVYDKSQDAYSFYNEQIGKYMVMETSIDKYNNTHNNAKLGPAKGFHKLSKITDNIFTIGETEKLWYKSRYTEFTFDGTPDNGKDQLLIISAKVDETPVISFAKSVYTLESTVTTLTIPFERNAFAIGDVTVDVTTGGDWLKVTSKTIQNPTTKIACTFNANDTGAERTATLTVKHANAKNQVITVKQLAAGTVNPTTVTVNWNDVASQYNLADESDLSASLAFDAFTFSWDANSGTKPRTWSNNSEMRLYKNNIMTIKATDASKKITKIVMKLSASANTGTYNGSTWTGSANSVIFTVSSKAKTQKVSTIEITYE